MDSAARPGTPDRRKTVLGADNENTAPGSRDEHSAEQRQSQEAITDILKKLDGKLIGDELRDEVINFAAHLQLRDTQRGSDPPDAKEVDALKGDLLTSIRTGAMVFGIGEKTRETLPLAVRRAGEIVETAQARIRQRHQKATAGFLAQASFLGVKENLLRNFGFKRKELSEELFEVMKREDPEYVLQDKRDAGIGKISRVREEWGRWDFIKNGVGLASRWEHNTERVRKEAVSVVQGWHKEIFSAPSGHTQGGVLKPQPNIDVRKLSDIQRSKSDLRKDGIRARAIIWGQAMVEKLPASVQKEFINNQSGLLAENWGSWFWRRLAQKFWSATAIGGIEEKVDKALNRDGTWTGAKPGEALEKFKAAYRKDPKNLGLPTEDELNAEVTRPLEAELAQLPNQKFLTTQFSTTLLIEKWNRSAEALKLETIEGESREALLSIVDERTGFDGMSVNAFAKELCERIAFSPDDVLKGIGHMAVFEMASNDNRKEAQERAA